MKDKLDLSILQHERDLIAAKLQLLDENLTHGETIAVHVEISQITFSLKTLNFIKS